MNKKLTMVIALLCLARFAAAQVTQTDDDKAANAVPTTDESAFTFTEAQLGEDDDMAQNVTILGSGTNLYASQAGYQFSPTRFRYRAFNQKYNDIYVNGMLLNDMETGQFRFSLVGGLNNQVRNAEHSLPFEDNYFALTSMGGSNNYNFRAGAMPVGSRVSLAGANRNYTLRGMYTYNSGFNEKGWAWSASLTYRWANTKTAYVPGTFYNSLSYFFGIEKIINQQHSLSLSTWGNPTERATQGGTTDEMYWIANSRFYNPYWGYQNGKVRNSRIVNDFAPSAILTWDWKINEQTKIVTSLGGRYSMYKNTSLDYNNADNPQPDYWKNMPTAYYNVWNPSSNRNNEYTPDEWKATYEYLTASEANRQINWDRLYAANKGTNALGTDAMYFIKAKHTDALTLQLNSVLNIDLSPRQHITAGIGLGSNHGRHYMSVDDLLGAQNFHNINTYALANYGARSEEVMYDVRDGGRNLKEGDTYRYDYFLNVQKASLWAAYTHNLGRVHFFIGGRTAYTMMNRDGQMLNGIARENSLGKSGTAKFGDGGGKAAMSINLGKGHAVSIGAGYELRAPQASTAFAAPEINNDFVTNLHNERVLSSEFSYQMKTSLIDLNLSAYYSHFDKVTEWQNYYFDDNNSFIYVSLTDIRKAAYGIEFGAKVKLASFLDFKALGTVSEAKYLNDCKARYMLSKRYEYVEENVLSKDMRESGTPLTAVSLGFSYHRDGWYIDLSANWYDRIYLSWAQPTRYQSVIIKRQMAGDELYDNDGNLIREAFAQEKGHGGWMLDGSIGKSIYLRKKGSLSINLSLTNILNNINICTGGYEQSRTNYTKNNSGGYDSRIYYFMPKKFYAYGTNGMLNFTWKY